MHQTPQNPQNKKMSIMSLNLVRFAQELGGCAGGCVVSVYTERTRTSVGTSIPEKVTVTWTTALTSAASCDTEAKGVSESTRL